MKYLVEVHLGEPGQIKYGAEVPALPGCHTVGNTLEELESNLREAVELWIDTAREDGREVAPPTGFILQIEVPA